MRKKPLVILCLIAAILLGVIAGLPYYRDSQLSRATAVLQIHPSEAGSSLSYLS